MWHVCMSLGYLYSLQPPTRTRARHAQLTPARRCGYSHRVILGSADREWERRFARAKGMAEKIAAAAALRAAFAAFDTDGSGTLTAAELAEALTRKGGGNPLGEDDARELIQSVDANGDGVLSIDEFTKLMSGLDNAPTAVVDFSDLVGPNGNVSIADTAKRAITLDQLTVLVAHVRRRIEGGETWPVKRFVSGAMVDAVVSDAKDANLYDLDRFVVRPATKPYQCAMVELMAEGEQPPDYFVSHFWGHSIVATLACLEVHSSDRGLERQVGFVDASYFFTKEHPNYLGGRSPRYWICAFANNQHNLAAEIADELSQTSFYRAMRLSRGTVSIVDEKAIVYSRIWCVFELYSSLVGRTTGTDADAVPYDPSSIERYLSQAIDAEDPAITAEAVTACRNACAAMLGTYTYDMYTAVEPYESSFTFKHRKESQHDGSGYSGPQGEGEKWGGDGDDPESYRRCAVGLTQGLTAIDQLAYMKAQRERFFPLELLDKGVRFECKHGQASVEADRLSILTKIGDQQHALDAGVHCIIAASALKKALDAGGEARERFFSAIRGGKLRRFSITMGNLDDDGLGHEGTSYEAKEALMREILNALSPDTLEQLSLLNFQIEELPEEIGRFKKLKNLSLEQCFDLARLPAALGQCTSLETLNLRDTNAQEFPDLSHMPVRSPCLKPTPSGSPSLPTPQPAMPPTHLIHRVLKPTLRTAGPLRQHTLRRGGRDRGAPILGLPVGQGREEGLHRPPGCAKGTPLGVGACTCTVFYFPGHPLSDFQIHLQMVRRRGRGACWNCQAVVMKIEGMPVSASLC